MKNLKEIEKDVFEVSARLKHIQEDIAKLQTKEPEFKVGQWVIGKDKDSPFVPARIMSIDEGVVNYLYWGNLSNVERESYQRKERIRPATKEEIESHLRPICDKKYVGKKVRDMLNGEIRKVGEFEEYDFERDLMSYYLEGNYNYAVRPYFDGKFAEIIPSKKKLPKTKEEFGAFLGAYCNRHTSSVDEFLNDYEDK